MTPLENKKTAIQFYKMAFEGNPEKAVHDYVGDDYFQHNPLVADGKQGLLIISIACKENILISLCVSCVLLLKTTLSLSIHTKFGAHLTIKNTSLWIFSALILRAKSLNTGIVSKKLS